MLRKIRGAILRISISFLSLAFVLYIARNELRDSISYLSEVDILFFLVALSIQFGSLTVVTVRLQMIMVVQGIIIGFFRTYYLWLISLFFNLFLPSAVGGDIAKAYYIYKDTHKKLAAVSSVLVDRFMGLMATISIGTGAFLLARDQINNPKIGSFLLLFVVITIVGTLFFMSKRFARPAKQLFVKMFPHRFQHKLQNFFEAVELYRDHRRCLVLAFVYSVAAQGCFITVYYFLALSLNISVPYVIFFLLIPLVNICSMVPSVGGLGVREASTVYLFSNYMLMEQAVALSLIGGVLIYGVGVLCGILYAIRGGASIQEMEKIEEENGVA